MNACIKKLRSQKGASLILASVYFLFCAFVGGVVLAAATGGSAHLKDRKADEQAFFIQRSAARAVASMLTVEDGYLQAEITQRPAEGGGYTYSLDHPGNTPNGFQILVAQAAAARYGENMDGVFDDYVHFGALSLLMSETEGERAENLSVYYSMDSDYDLTITFMESEDDVPLLHIFMKANESTVERSGAQITRITWNEPVIRKGGGDV